MSRLRWLHTLHRWYQSACQYIASFFEHDLGLKKGPQFDVVNGVNEVVISFHELIMPFFFLFSHLKVVYKFFLGAIAIYNVFAKGIYHDGL